MATVQTADLIADFELELVSGEKGSNRYITESDLYRPGIELAGFFKCYPEGRIQILGHTELAFFEQLSEKNKVSRMKKLCTNKTPCIIITRNSPVPTELIQVSEALHVPVLRTNQQTTRFLSRLTNYLESKLAPSITLHGVLVDIYGVGVLLVGKSGIGKSETALELIKRGHRLVADDCVEIHQEDEILIGKPPSLIKHLLEIRGLGILDIMTMFGAGSVRSAKEISLIIHLEIWDAQKDYDRLGIDEEKMKILEAEITKLTIPVRPGRNLASIVEAGAMNYRLKGMGINVAMNFNEKLLSAMDR